MSPGNHDLTGHGLLEIEDAFDHFTFIRVDQSPLFTLINYLLDFRRFRV